MSKMPCAIWWCVALAAPDGAHCAVHAARPDFIVDREQRSASMRVPLGKTTADPERINDCDYCEGTGQCPTCDGTGEHDCLACNRDHMCGCCSGSGTCEECHGEPSSDPSDPTDDDARLLAWMNEAMAPTVCRPPTPWDDEPPWWVREAQP